MKILAVDYGDARTGLAVCDQEERLASPVGVVHQRKMDGVADAVAAAAAEQRAACIVVGNPLNMDGSAGPRSQLCQEFAELVRQRTGLPVHLWDERSTTVTATYYLNITDTRGKKRKNVVDAVAATIILEGFMNFRRLHPDQNQESGPEERNGQ